MKVSQIRTAQHRQPEHDIFRLFTERWSPRAMSGEPVTIQELNRLFEAARWAPSSYNEQPWRFIYAMHGTPAWDTMFNLLVEGNRAWCGTAGALLTLCAKRSFSHNAKPNGSSVFDAGAAWQNFALQGSHMGLVVHAMAGFDRDKAREDLHIPEDYAVCCMIAVGRVGDVSSLPLPLRERELPSGRKKIEEFVMEGAFRA